MIAIVSSSARERRAFAALCSARKWAFVEGDSVRTLRRLLLRDTPQVVLTRDKLSDGYSDDVIGLFRRAGAPLATRIIVLIGAAAFSSHEARQIALGADCVQRDPVRTDVLIEYIARFRHADPTGAPRLPVETFPFASATVFPLELRLEHRNRTTPLAPREVELLQLLHEGRGHVVTYETLYREILGRRFAGDTSNLRVLLGKVARSFARVGIAVRSSIRVIPKSGYRYDPPEGDGAGAREVFPIR